MPITQSRLHQLLQAAQHYQQLAEGFLSSARFMLKIVDAGDLAPRDALKDLVDNMLSALNTNRSADLTVVHEATRYQLTHAKNRYHRDFMARRRARADGLSPEAHRLTTRGQELADRPNSLERPYQPKPPNDQLSSRVSLPIGQSPTGELDDEPLIRPVHLNDRDYAQLNDEMLQADYARRVAERRTEQTRQAETPIKAQKPTEPESLFSSEVLDDLPAEKDEPYS